ncbi:MAG: flagellar type III secretion system pore protein FliP [Thermoleophilia bacterium]
MAAPNGISINLGTKGTGASGTLQIIALMTVLSLAPSVVIMMTSFTRTIIVLSFVRNALGTQQIPPNQVMVGVALFLTMFVMTPTFGRINDQAVQPLINNRINEQTALRRAEAPLRDFMFNQMSSDSSEIAMFMDMAKEPKATTRADVPTRVLIPAFVLSELKKSFEIGFLVFIPFLIIDIVVASTVMSMGMVMLPPTVISLPFKILLFVLVDGWTLVAESLVRGFNAG